MGGVLFKFRNGTEANEKNIQRDRCPGIQCGDADSGACFSVLLLTLINLC